MPKKAPPKKKKGPDISIKVDNVEKLIKKCAAEDRKKKKWGCCGGGCSGFWIFGSALAIVMSYVQNSSILWAIFHGIISWIYVAYRAIILYM